jgi:hypothetical protein
MLTVRPAIGQLMIVFGCRGNCVTINQFHIALHACSADFRQTWSILTFNRRTKERGMKMFIAVQFCFPVINV